MGPTHFYGTRAEKNPKADFAMKQTNICRLSGDRNNSQTPKHYIQVQCNYRELTASSAHNLDNKQHASATSPETEFAQSSEGGGATVVLWLR